MTIPDARRRHRILFVLKSSGGGSLINLLLLVRNLDRERFDPVVLFYETNPYVADFEEAGAAVHILRHELPGRSKPKTPGGVKASARRRFRAARILNGFLRRDLPAARRIADVIREVEPDLVQSNICPSADRASILAAGLARVPHVSYAQYWTNPAPYLDNPLSLFVERYLCISEAVQAQVREAISPSRSRTRVVYAPFEFPQPVAPAKVAEVRARLGLNGKHMVVTNVGRIVEWKGQDVFLRAFAEIANDHPHAVALLVGSPGNSSQGREFEAGLNRLASDLGLVDRVILTGHRDDVDEIMSASDVIVHSSSEPEPLGRVIMEAIALGVPIIGTAAGGVPEMIEEGVTGYLVRRGDVGDMARKLGSVLANPGRRTNLAGEAAERARSRFSSRAFIEVMESEYRKVLRHGLERR